MLLFSGWSGCCQIYVFICVVSSSCIPVHVSRTCSCDSMVSVHLRHLVSLYLPLKLFFTSSILVLALKMVDASILLSRPAALSKHVYIYLVVGCKTVHHIEVRVNLFMIYNYVLKLIRGQRAINKKMQSFIIMCGLPVFIMASSLVMQVMPNVIYICIQFNM